MLNYNPEHLRLIGAMHLKLGLQLASKHICITVCKLLFFLTLIDSQSAPNIVSVIYKSDTSLVPEF